MLRNQSIVVIIVVFLTISCASTSDKNFLLKPSETELSDNDIAYLGTYEFSTSSYDVVVPELIENEGQRSLYTIFKDEFEYKFDTPKDRSSDFSENTSLIEQLQLAAKEYRSQQSKADLPQNSGSENFEMKSFPNRYGIINFLKKSERKRGGGLQGGFYQEGYSVFTADLISLVLDLENMKVLSVYSFNGSSDLVELSENILFKAMTYSLADDSFYAANAFTALVNSGTRTVSITFKDGSLFYGKISYDLENEVVLETVDGTTTYHISEVVRVVDSLTGSQLFPTVIQEYN